jgi:hypothetical protein
MALVKEAIEEKFSIILASKKICCWDFKPDPHTPSGFRDKPGSGSVRIQINPDYTHYMVSIIVKYIYCRCKM